MYRVCGHCHQRLSEKALKEHERLYLEDGVWLTESKIEQGVSSSEKMSEPITISDPPDPDEEVPEPLTVSFEGEFPFEDVEQNSEEDSDQEGKLTQHELYYERLFGPVFKIDFIQVKKWSTGQKAMMS